MVLNNIITYSSGNSFLCQPPPPSPPITYIFLTYLKGISKCCIREENGLFFFNAPSFLPLEHVQSAEKVYVPLSTSCIFLLATSLCRSVSLLSFCPHTCTLVFNLREKRRVYIRPLFVPLYSPLCIWIILGRTYIVLRYFYKNNAVWGVKKQHAVNRCK